MMMVLIGILWQAGLVWSLIIGIKFIIREDKTIKKWFKYVLVIGLFLILILTIINLISNIFSLVSSL